MRRGLLFLLLMLFTLSAVAKFEVHQFDDPVKEARYKQLIAELRCLVCQNQNLADSNAELAQDLRQQTYDMVQQGSTTEEVVVYMVQRYGDFILYRPPFKSSTALLWIGPFVILGGSILVLFIFIRRSGRQKQPDIDPTDLERAKSLLDNEDTKL
ncbi:cytochrome c-type biogenesis protein [Candidatus Vondammii sp. HM_W22]|uniref:cytochrome c-type biogenesis protein n=1 Tax=Candidatus Vondammii sp. HM_W22 TaxID=2687299 RepID=UPI002E7B7CBC|nr:cytochrome c-type biogenesis protein [Candidatus Vondammii sp. HM_W22]